MKFEYDNYFWQGEKVRLCALQLEDAEQKLAEYTDSEARLFLECGIDLPPVSMEAYREGLKPYCNFEDTKQVTMFSIQTLDGQRVGWLNFFPGNKRSGVFAAGMSIYRQYQQQGYGSDALAIILRYAFDELRYQKCNSGVMDSNIGSIKLHQKLGFKEEGRRRRTIYTGGEFHDEILFGLLKEEFNN